MGTDLGKRSLVDRTNYLFLSITRRLETSRVVFFLRVAEDN